MKKLMFFAVAAIALVACTKTYEKEEAPQQEIGFGTWNDVMTKAPKTGFVNGDTFDIYGFKWNDGPDDETNVFKGYTATYNSSTSKWNYSPKRYWDSNFDHYTFFAASPAGQLAAAANENDYVQSGLFVSNELLYNGSDEVLLVAQKKDVAKASYGNTVPLLFKHTASLVDIKFKKHSELEDAVVTVNSIKLSGIQTKGKFTVVSYDSENNNNPVGKTVSGVSELGWELAETPVVNAANAAAATAPYVHTSDVTLNSGAGVGIGTANAADLITNLVLMPQVLSTTGGPMITISYTITTGSGDDEESIQYTNKEFYFGLFDRTEPDAPGLPGDKQNSDPRVSAWMPNVHYTYYITINANAIEFSASIDTWATDNAHYYLVQ